VPQGKLAAAPSKKNQKERGGAPTPTWSLGEEYDPSLHVSALENTIGLTEGLDETGLLYRRWTRLKHLQDL
jgi:hypothetical protein